MQVPLSMPGPPRHAGPTRHEGVTQTCRGPPRQARFPRHVGSPCMQGLQACRSPPGSSGPLHAGSPSHAMVSQALMGPPGMQEPSRHAWALHAFNSSHSLEVGKCLTKMSNHHIWAFWSLIYPFFSFSSKKFVRQIFSMFFL